jgi:hypothetical protein
MCGLAAIFSGRALKHGSPIYGCHQIDLFPKEPASMTAPGGGNSWVDCDQLSRVTRSAANGCECAANDGTEH